MRNKKPNSEALKLNASVLDISCAPRERIKEYLERIKMESSAWLDEKERKRYEYVRKAFVDALPSEISNEAVYAALAERIARTTILLDRIELELLEPYKPEEPMTNVKELFSQMVNRRTFYTKLLDEHRKFVEVFTNLRFAERGKSKTRMLERLREITEEDD